MGNYAEVWVGSFYLGRTKSQADPQLMKLFRESDRKVVHCKKHDLPFRERLWFDHVKDDEDITAFYYSAPVRTIRDHLELRGYTLATAKSAFSLCLQAEANCYPEWRKHFNLLTQASADQWLEAMRSIKQHAPGDDRDCQVGKLVSLVLDVDWYGCPGPDLNVPLRLALEVCEDGDEVICDLTDLLLAEYEYVSPDENFGTYERGLTGGLEYPNGKTIILTEGHSDCWIIFESLKVLYPHLTEYFAFMDFEGLRIPGGAGNLANIVKAFAGAGIVNKTIAVFDNDTAAEDAIRPLQDLRRPANIRILRLPELTFLHEYPTVGPTGTSITDVNGYAASIELYLGRDVLADGNGNLPPVQWTGYNTGLRKYQGEVLYKNAIHERFRHRLQACARNPELLKETDWAGLRAILSAIFVAFHDLDGERIIDALKEHYDQ
jgi:hypothetical protein